MPWKRQSTYVDYTLICELGLEHTVIRKRRVCMDEEDELKERLTDEGKHIHA